MSSELKTGLPDEPLFAPSAAGRSSGPPRWRIRWRVYRKTPELDRALAAGTDPLKDAYLLLRAQQLVEPSLRLATAERIDRLVADARRAVAGAPYAAMSPSAAELVTTNRSLLMVLAERLRGEGPFGLPGLAMTQRLVGVGYGHLYRSPSPLHLKWRLLEALAALEPRSPWAEH